MMSINSNLRAFKTARFSKDAKKAKITDVELCQAIEQVLLSQVDDLGGGVFKKRLNDNLHRSIILAKGGKYWVFEYLFPRRSDQTLKTMNYLRFACWPTVMLA